VPRVLPSQVVQLIDELFLQALTTPHFSVGAGPQLTAIVAYARQIPVELLQLQGQDLSDFVVALEYMESAEKQRLALQRGTAVLEYRESNVIILLRAALMKCPDEAPAPGTADLLFVTDGDLRESIRRDISAANQDMTNGEWKGATVLAGSATEALLLWAIKEAEAKAFGTVARGKSLCLSTGALAKTPRGAPEHWSFIELIEIALTVGAIKGPTAKQARLGKNFRNLIHPGRATRLGEVCDQGTAFSALAAVAFVVRDLTRQAEATAQE
jgi:hypothetical protein